MRQVWLVVVTLTVASCAPHTRTVRTETVQQSSVGTTPTVPSTTVRDSTTETTVVSERHEEPRGLISGTVHVVGEILALPFRLVGGLIRLLF